MAEVTLEERGRALEDQFFEKENQQKLAAMKQRLDAQQTREELRKASGMTDDAVLDKLVALGLRSNTIAALSLVPLIAVAWADGEIQDNERTAILQGAHGKGLEQAPTATSCSRPGSAPGPSRSCSPRGRPTSRRSPASSTRSRTACSRTRSSGSRRWSRRRPAASSGSARCRATRRRCSTASKARSRAEAGLRHDRDDALARQDGRQGLAGRARRDVVRRRRRRGDRRRRSGAPRATPASTSSTPPTSTTRAGPRRSSAG